MGYGGRGGGRRILLIILMGCALQFIISDPFLDQIVQMSPSSFTPEVKIVTLFLRAGGGPGGW